MKMAASYRSPIIYTDKATLQGQRTHFAGV
jgi:hypothetical protein